MEFLSRNMRWLSAGALLTFFSAFGQTYFISIFAADIQEAYGLSHGGWGLVYTLGTTASAVVMIWAGRQADIFRVRTLGALTLGALGIACLAMAWNPWLWALPVVVFFLRLTGQGMLSHIAIVAMGRWFVANRGKALSIAALGFAVGQAFLPIGVVALMNLTDWQTIWLLCALTCAVFVPVVLTLLTTERTPQAMAKEARSLGMNERHWTRHDLLHHPLFWLMVPALLGPSAFNTAFFFHQVHFAEIKDITKMQMVSHFPLYTAVSVAAMLLSGVVLDRLGTPRLLPLHQVPLIAAFVLFAGAETHLGLTLAFICLGLTAGATATLPAAFWAEFYGTAHLGAIKALAAAVMVLGSAIGPGLTGVLIDTGVTLETQYLWVGGYFAMTTGFMWWGVARYKKLIAPRQTPSESAL